jgi:sensor histidine kinase YesM
MWERIVAWHRAWEQEQVDVLQDPARADGLAPGYRRQMAEKIAELSPVERRQLHDFVLKYRGRRGHLALARMLLIASAGGVVLHLIFPARTLLSQILLADAVALAAGLAYLIAYFNYRRMVSKSLRICAVLMLCAGLGALAGATQDAHEKGISLAAAIETRWLKALLMGAGAGLFFAGPMAMVGALRNQQYQALTAKLELDAERHRAARELSESRLRMLRAQIEPHFLFNTLGAVQQLAEQGAPRAAELTANLIAFLRASLADMRSERLTLAADFALVDAYLTVMAARLGARLDYQLALPAALAQTSVPSMMLLTLVENAIKHGIEPALRGGSIVVAAERQGDRLRLSVQDSGVGLAAEPGSGDGLDNVRSRLQLLYAGQAELTVAEAGEGGVLAVITLPLASGEAAR